MWFVLLKIITNIYVRIHDFAAEYCFEILRIVANATFFRFPTQLVVTRVFAWLSSHNKTDTHSRSKRMCDVCVCMCFCACSCAGRPFWYTHADWIEAYEHHTRAKYSQAPLTVYPYEYSLLGLKISLPFFGSLFWMQQYCAIYKCGISSVDERCVFPYRWLDDNFIIVLPFHFEFNNSEFLLLQINQP